MLERYLFTLLKDNEESKTQFYKMLDQGWYIIYFKENKDTKEMSYILERRTI